MQSIYGNPLELIQQEVSNNGTSWPPQMSLRLWSLPRSQTDETTGTTGHGLDGGITWAWDDALCSHLQPHFRESAAGINLVDCTHLKAAMHRAFESWAANHRLISFVDVTEECRRLNGFVNITAGCQLAEILVGPSPSSECIAQSALAMLTHAYSDTFRFTNGAYAREWNSAIAAFQPRKVTEITGAVITFSGSRDECDSICWYLDATFCTHFHTLKKSMAGQDVRIMMISITCVVSGIASLISLCHIVQLIRGHMKALGNCSARCKTTTGQLAKWSLCGMAVRWVAIITPVMFYVQIFLPCFDVRSACEHLHVQRAGEPWSDASFRALDSQVL